MKRSLKPHRVNSFPRYQTSGNARGVCFLENDCSLVLLTDFIFVVSQSNRSFNIPPGIWTFEDWLVHIPSSRGKKAVQMHHQLVLKYLSSKTNFVFNQTLFTSFRESYAMMTTSNFFWRPFWKSYSLTKAKFYLVNLSNLAKRKKHTGVLRQNKR